MAYIYQADVWCDTCGAKICEDIQAEGKAPEDVEDESSFDSDEYPKGYSPDHEEADGPENCAGCGEFLRNGLTSDGYSYLKSMLDEHGENLPDAVQEWADYYSFSYLSADDIAEDEYETREPGWYSPEQF